jgi:D-lactate dehydrogenase (cytochrome)
LTSPRRGEALREDLESVLARALDDGLVADAVIATSLAQGRALWHIREAMVEAQKHEGASIKHDVAVPLSRVAEFVRRASALVEAAVPGARPVAFGHVGDGNVHFNLSQPVGADGDVFLARWGEINRLVHDLVVDMDGSFSAEHGIGRLKRDDLSCYKSEVEVDLMRRLKRALDPDGIMNPGKVV